jgi:hypothetical protein
MTTTRGLQRDVGYIDDVDPETGELKARFDVRSVTYGFGELVDLPRKTGELF